MSGGAWWMAGRSSLLDGLVHAWPLAGNVTDAVTGVAATPTSITYAAGKFGSAAQFAGVGSVVTTTASPVLGALPRSFACWFKRHVAGGYLLDCGAAAGSNRLIISSPSGMGIRVSTQAVDVLNTPDLSLDVYHFMAVTYDGTAVKAYVNGAAPVSANITLNTTDVAIKIGVNFTGAVEQFLAANRVWTAAELAALYNSGTGKAYPFSE